MRRPSRGARASIKRQGLFKFVVAQVATVVPPRHAGSCTASFAFSVCHDRMEEVAQAQITALCTGKDCRREALDDLTLDGRVKSAGPVKVRASRTRDA